jgi:uncharacterized protein (UPF0303 family)
MTDVMTTLERQEQELVFASFDHTDASGLSSQEDHDLIVDGIRAYLADGGGM